MKLFGEEQALKRKCAQQTAFYHVLIADEQKPDKLRQLYVDLDEKELKQKLVKPYKKGTSLICGNEIIPVMQIQKIHIVQTAQCNKVEREAMNNRGSQSIEKLNSMGIACICVGIGYRPQDILKAPGAKDVTSRYITAPPGTVAAFSLFARFVNHPWVVTVGAGLVVVYLGWKLGWNR